MKTQQEQNGSTPAQPLVVLLLPIMAAVSAAFLVTGFTMTVLPVYVHNRLGFDTFVVGLVAGAQFAAALLSRFWAGTQADRYGGKRAVLIGLVLGLAAGFLYFASLQFISHPEVSVLLLLLGRAVFGGAESFIVTGALSWGLAAGGPQNTGRVMAWIGTAMYVALAAGAPLGTLMYGRYGFGAIAVATTLVSLLVLLFALRQPFTAPPASSRPSIVRVVGAVALPGMGLAFSSLGFAAISTFVVLLFTRQGWPMGWLAVTTFAVAFVIARLFLSHLADAVGGGKVAFVSALVEALGLAVIWLAPGPAVAFAGAAVTGLGYSLVYPGFGVEAVRRAPAESRGLAMGAYTAFLDLALGVANPVLGLVASHTALNEVFLVSAGVVLGAAAIGFSLLPAGLRVVRRR
ncbi:arabinose transporter [Paraflavisolibacter sp. H34]|uniref:arabinose transporter n=1 Tax=Huijunlia imazamoxiresistens TaxID=3127457 RepID=UPI00301AD092